MRFVFPLLVVAVIFGGLVWVGAAWWWIALVGVFWFLLFLGLLPMILAGRTVNVRDIQRAQQEQRERDHS